MSFPLKPLKWYKKLATRKGRLEAEAFIVEGERAISQIIAGSPEQVIEILTVNEPPPVYRKYPVRSITESQCDYICSTKTPQGSMAVVRMPVEIYSDHLPDDTGNRILLLEDIQDPGNVGTLIRTAAAFDFSGVIMSAKSADPLSPKCIQAAAGTILSVWTRRTEGYLELTQALKEENFTVAAADVHGNESVSVLKHQGKLILTLGNETAGLSDMLLNMADYRLRIATVREKAESLNVAVAGAICMYVSSQL